MKIHADVLPVLSLAAIDGNAVRLTGQLDRKLYLRTNEVLEALGGKWNRKAKAHLFDRDATLAIETALLTGEVTTYKDIGFFPTPEPLAMKLCAMARVEPGMQCLEPSAGTGNIVRALLSFGAKVTAIERDVHMRKQLMELCSVAPYDDFIECDLPSFMSFDRVVMNPPFLKSGLGDHLDHVRHAFAMLSPGGILVSVLPSGIEFRKDRKHTAFADWYQSLGGVVEKLPPDSFKSSGTSVSTVTLTLRAR